jgi:transposase-like protein
MNEITMMKRSHQRHSAEQRLQWVMRYERSGQSMREFCLENDLAYATLSLWRREARKAGESPPTASLVEVRVASAGSAYGALKVRVPSGVELEVSSGTDARWLAAVLHALQSPVEG